MACTGAQMMADAACLDCLLPPGQLRDAVELVLWIDLYHGTPPDAEALATYIARASCYLCVLTGASLEAAKLAVFFAMARGDDDLDTTPQGLLNASNCILCVVPVGMLLAVRLALACAMQNDTEVPSTAAGLPNLARCYLCYGRGHLLQMWVGALCASANYEEMDCSPAGLALLANCASCVPQGLLQVAGLAIMLGLSHNPMGDPPG